MPLPSDLLTRSADEAIRRVAVHLLDEARSAAERVQREPSDPDAAIALVLASRRLAVHLDTFGSRFSLCPAALLRRAASLASRARAADLDEHPSSVAFDVLSFADEARTPLRTLAVELDATPQGPSFGVVLAGMLRWFGARAVSALEDPTEADPEAARSLDDLLRNSGAATIADELLSTSRRDSGSIMDPCALRERVDDRARELEANAESEIEHKYLLRGFPPAAATVTPKELAQGYVPGERLHERLRSVRVGDRVRYLRTVKLGSGVSRMEIEEETSEDVFGAMWPLTEGARVHKERYAMRDGALTWTIDRFVDRDLVLAEVEVPSTRITPMPPAWLREYIVREVTDDPAYLNLNLAR